MALYIASEKKKEATVLTSALLILTFRLYIWKAVAEIRFFFFRNQFNRVFIIYL